MTHLKLLTLCCFCIFTNSFSQTTTTKDNIQIEIVKSKLVDNESVFGIRQLKVTNEKLRKVMIKSKIKSTTDKTKLSAFYLLDVKNKIRYRLADYKGYTGFIGYPELIPYRKERFFDEKGNEIKGEGWPIYNESVKDYFKDYDIEGYSNFEMKINFGSAKKPKLSVVYFGETSYEKFTAELFFAIIVEHKAADYELYYKDEKISDIKFQ
jgi:hypothetical protein